MDTDSHDAAPVGLAARVAAADRGEAPPAANAGALAAPPPGPPDESAQWRDAAVQYGAVVREMLPAKAREAWTPERLQALGDALARCAKHYGWQFGSALNHPVAGLIVVSFPLAWPLLEPYLRPALERMRTPEKQVPGEPAPPAPPDEAPPR